MKNDKKKMLQEQIATLELRALGGKEIIPAVMIRDGLSQATIKAIQDDLSRSFELATMVNPAMVRA